MQGEFLQDLLLDAIRKIDLISEKVDSKLDALEERMADDHREFREAINVRLEPVEKQLLEHGSTIKDHANYFKLMAYCFTGGLASLAGAWQWLSQILPPHK